jgi:hypothetical protein
VRHVTTNFCHCGGADKASPVNLQKHRVVNLDAFGPECSDQLWLLARVKEGNVRMIVANVRPQYITAANRTFTVIQQKIAAF